VVAVVEEDGGWRPLWRLEITPGLGCSLTVASLALFAASIAAVIALGGWLHPGSGYGSTPLAPVIVELTVALLATFALHEGVHALAFKLVGGRRVRFGAGLPSGFPVLYVGWPGQRISRDRFVLVVLAPLVVLDLVGLALMLPGVTVVAGATVVVLNTAGAVGDLWMAAIMLSSPSWLHVEDMGLSLLAWAPPAHAAGAAAMSAPGGPGIAAPPDPAAIAAGRRRAAGEGRGWRQAVVWWVVLAVILLPSTSAPASALTPLLLHAPPDAVRRIATGWPYLLAGIGGAAALAGLAGALLVFLGVAASRLLTRRACSRS
jgi:hypothetical protein